MASISASSPVTAPADIVSGAMIGPNAVSQTLRAAAELEGTTFYAAVARRANLPATDADGMIPEDWFIRLVEALRVSLPWPRSEAILRRAGEYTADYVAANRIPAVIRGLLRVLPARLAVPLLLTAFRRHAWTFAGSGRFGTEGHFPGAITLTGCPTCSHGSNDTGLAGAYYEAAFEGLLRLAAPRVTVREFRCEACGDAGCGFAIEIEGVDARGET